MASNDDGDIEELLPSEEEQMDDIEEAEPDLCDLLQEAEEHGTTEAEALEPELQEDVDCPSDAAHHATDATQLSEPPEDPNAPPKTETPEPEAVETQALTRAPIPTPPSDTKTTPPPGTEVFFSRLPTDATMTQVRAFAERAGTVYELRLPPDHLRPDKNRGYAFCVFSTAEGAETALKELQGAEVAEEFKSKPVTVAMSDGRNRLFIGGLPKDLTQAEVLSIFQAEVKGTLSFELMKSPEGSRGFGFLSFLHHAAAGIALSHLSKTDFKVVPGRALTIEFAEPKKHDTEERSGQTLYVTNLPADTTEEHLQGLLCSYGTVVSVSIIRPQPDEPAAPSPRGKRGVYAFVQMKERAAATAVLTDVEAGKPLMLQGRTLIVQMARPQTRELDRESNLRGGARGGGPRERERDPRDRGAMGHPGWGPPRGHPMGPPHHYLDDPMLMDMMMSDMMMGGPPPPMMDMMMGTYPLGLPPPRGHRPPMLPPPHMYGPGSRWRHPDDGPLHEGPRHEHREDRERERDGRRRDGSERSERSKSGSRSRGGERSRGPREESSRGSGGGARDSSKRNGAGARDSRVVRGEAGGSPPGGYMASSRGAIVTRSGPEPSSAPAMAKPTAPASGYVPRGLGAGKAVKVDGGSNPRYAPY